jgi:hypothetical protein
MDNQMLLEVARLVSLQSTLLFVMAGTMLVGLIVLGWELYAIAKGLRGLGASLEAIAAMTAEVLRRTPER